MKSTTARTVCIAALLSVTMLLLNAGTLMADDIYWDDWGGGAFDDSNNWTPTQVPGSGDTAIFNTANTYMVDMPFGITTNLGCHILCDEVAFNLNSQIYELTSTDKPFVVGWDNYAYAEMLGGTVNTVNAHIGLEDYSDGTLFLAGTVMNVDNLLNVGNYGNGSLTIDSDAAVNTLNLQVGAQAGGNAGYIELADSTSSLTVTGSQFNVGESGYGSMAIQGGATVKTIDAGGWMVLGKRAGAYGGITVIGDSTLEAEGAPIVVGGDGEGLLEVLDGSTAKSSGELFVAYSAAGSIGNVNISNYSQYVSTSIYTSKIGDAGEGTLTIGNDSTVEVQRMVIGVKTDSTGKVELLDETGALLDIETNLTVGREGTGELIVGGQGKVAIGDVDPVNILEGEVHLGTGGELRGTGSITCTRVVNTAGELRPGGTQRFWGVTTGILTIESGYLQETDGTLCIEIGGTTRGDDYSALVAMNVGHIVLGGTGGTLRLELVNGFQPTAGDTFDILDWDSLTGTFDVLPDADDWDTSRLYSHGEVTYVPEPATLTLLALGGLAMLKRKRK